MLLSLCIGNLFNGFSYRMMACNVLQHTCLRCAYQFWINEKNIIWNIISYFDFFFLFQFELLFCLQDESDPALMVVKALMEKYPKVDAKIFIGKLLGSNREKRLTLGKTVTVGFNQLFDGLYSGI